MTIKRNVQLPRSSVKGAKPRADELEFGSLAVNFFAGDEFLSTKNSDQKVVVFPSKNYIEKHPFSSLTIDNLAVNSGASISGNTIIDGSLRVSGDTYLGGRTYLKSGNTLVAIENFITETAQADGNNYITGGSATNNTISLTGKGLARATITNVVTSDKVAEAVETASNGKFVHTTGDTITGTLNFTSQDATKINFNGSSSIQNLTDEASSKTKLNITAGDEHLYYNGKPIANLADSRWEAGAGNGAVLLKGSNGSAAGECSVSEGHGCHANGNYSHAEGYITTASGTCSHAEGNGTSATGAFSHAEGQNTIASGKYSHAEGQYGIAVGYLGHVEGLHNHGLNVVKDVTKGDKSITVYNPSNQLNLDYYKNCYIYSLNGWKTRITGASYDNSVTLSDAIVIKFDVENELPIDAKYADAEKENQHGDYFFTWKYTLTNIGATKEYAQHAEGKYTMCIGDASHAEGDSSMAVGNDSHAEGNGTTASGSCSHAEGSGTTATGESSHAEGNKVKAVGKSSHAEGDSTTASGDYSHAEGSNTTASGSCSHAEGQNTTASGSCSHAEGYHTTASGDWSHAEGQITTANGNFSHAEGNHTIAMNEGEHACGSYNSSVLGSGQVFSVGAGTSDNNRVNSFYVKNDGTIGSDLDMSINANSKITLSTTSDRLIMSGGTLTTNCTMTTGAYFTTSDERLKTNIVDVTEDEIEKAKKVDLKSFELKRDGKKHFGVVAQEVETAGLAELVNTDSEGMKSVDYTSLLILKIAELEKEIKDLKNQINNK